MGFRFRKSFKIAPGFRVNIGKRGITSFTIGKRGANLNISKKGVYSNIGIKGTGLSYRAKLASSQPQKSRKMGRASKINQLEKIERMYSKGQLTEAEYWQLREEVMSEGRLDFSQIETTEPPPKRRGCLAIIGKIIGWGIVILILIGILSALSEDSTPNSNAPQQQQREAPTKTHEATSPPVRQRNDSGKTEGYKPMSDDERKQVDSLF